MKQLLDMDIHADSLEHALKTLRDRLYEREQRENEVPAHYNIRLKFVLINTYEDNTLQAMYTFEVFKI